MSNKKAEDQVLKIWCEAATASDAIEWARLPELKLYMDQVLTLLEKELAVASLDGENPVTSSMINNYVKDGVLPRPDKKKYGREHLAMLYMIAMLKSQLPLPQIAQLSEELAFGENIQPLYDDFLLQQQAALAETVDRIETVGNERAALAAVAMSLALEANAKRLAAMNILQSLAPDEMAEKQAAKAEKEAAKAAKKEAKKAAKESEDKA